jgi:S-DNA-T family DNA segregation ATPase FtsK/SpoIIIE
MAGASRSERRPPVRPEPPSDPRLQEQKREICGVLLLGIAFLAALAIWFNGAGFIGEIVKQGFFYLFGARGAMIPVLFIAIGGLSLFGWGRGIRHARHFIALLMLFTAALTLLHFASGVRIVEGNWENAVNGGGVTGHWLALNILLFFGNGGAIIIGILWLAIAFILALDKPLAVLIATLFRRRVKEITATPGLSPDNFETQPPAAPVLHSMPPQHLPENVIPFPVKRETGSKREGSLIATLQGILREKEHGPSQEEAEIEATAGGKAASYAGQPLVLGPYSLPHINLLGTAAAKKTAGRVIDQSRQLEETLAHFGVQVRVIEVHHGPVVTRYDLQPAPGVQVRRIVSLTDDLALALAAKGLRLEAPIPGKAAIGVEVPNPEPQIVTCRDVFDTKLFWNSSKLSFALGRDIGGEVVMADLTRMPHLLIAGATGSGKSVCINTLIMSILFKAFPDEVKLIMIDPKMVELSMYNGIPHLLAPVVTESKRAAGVLKIVVDEMDRRYKLFTEARVRDLDKYNQQLSDGDALPYIVVIIDELADLMMVAPVEVEDSICRLAQMARATGIHLVVATQRPSVDVITGLIKANIPSRIAFAVFSQIDSRTILDGVGAERLLGRGDMLFSPGGAMKPHRIQGALVSEKEIEAVIKHWKEQGEPKYEEQFTRIPEARGSFTPDQDELFWDAARVVTEHGQASASVLQRRLRVGYTRAARLVDMLEAKGLVGPYEGSKPREVYVTLRQLEELRQREKTE